MKKLAMILAFLMMVPGAAFGLEMMNDSSMDEVTGQAGVSIAMDDIQIFMNIERVAWIDADGFEDYATSLNADNTVNYAAEGSGGAVGISNFQIDVLNVNAPDTAVAKADGVWDLTNSNANSQIDLQFDYGDTTNGNSAAIATGYDSGLSYNSVGDLGTQTYGLNNYQSVNDPLSGSSRYMPSALTIDATSQLPVLTYAKTSALTGSGFSAGATTNVNMGGVMIGIPTVEIYIPSLTMTPAFYNLEDVSAANRAKNDVEDASYGTIALDGVTFTTLSGWLEIAPH